jgi:hypothetical protein
VNWLFPPFLLAALVLLLMAVHFLFRLRDHAGQKITGTLVLLSGLPALGVLIWSAGGAEAVMSIIAPSLWLAFVLLDFMLDYLLKVEFRKGKPLLLTIFLALYYGATICLWAASYPGGILPYLAVSLLFLLQAGLSIALRIKEVSLAKGKTP